MKIQITDRILWLSKVNTAIQDILDERQRRDDEYLALPWYRSMFKNSYDCPSLYAWGDLAKLRSVKAALESEGTGDVYLNAEELQSIL